MAAMVFETRRKSPSGSSARFPASSRRRKRFSSTARACGFSALADKEDFIPHYILGECKANALCVPLVSLRITQVDVLVETAQQFSEDGDGLPQALANLRIRTPLVQHLSFELESPL